jgi:hypothetical protein
MPIPATPGGAWGRAAAGYGEGVGIVRLAIVYDEIEAEMLCQVLRDQGIECGHRRTNVSAGAWRVLPTIGGQREVFVDEIDADVARNVLEGWESPAAEDEAE